MPFAQRTPLRAAIRIDSRAAAPVEGLSVMLDNSLRSCHERVTGLIKTTLHIKPADGSTHWSVRGVAAEAGMFKAASSATSSCSACSLIAARASSSPTLLDEEWIERTQPMLPMGLGYVEGVTHDYKRHGTRRVNVRHSSTHSTRAFSGGLRYKVHHVAQR